MTYLSLFYDCIIAHLLKIVKRGFETFLIFSNPLNLWIYCFRSIAIRAVLISPLDDSSIPYLQEDCNRQNRQNYEKKIVQSAYKSKSWSATDAADQLSLFRVKKVQAKSSDSENKNVKGLGAVKFSRSAAAYGDYHSVGSLPQKSFNLHFVQS